MVACTISGTVAYSHVVMGVTVAVPRTAPPARRGSRLEGVVSWRGRWYVVGHDVDRAATRVFRLGRITGGVRAGSPGSAVTPPPPDLDLRAVAGRYAEEPATRSASLLVRRGAGGELRRGAIDVRPGPDGWDEVTVGFADPERLADRAAGLGRDAVVIAPVDAREAVVRRLEAAAGAAGAA